MKSLTLMLLLIVFNTTALCRSSSSCEKWPSFLKTACLRVGQIWHEGDREIYLSGYAWHNRFRYSSDRVSRYNELAWGGGLGKGLYDEKGNWHGLYAFAFLDSHRNVEPIAGYSYLKIAHFTEEFKLGAGFSVFLTARPDIFNNIPFPGALPWVACTFKRVTLAATYIPGASDAGNVLFLVSKITF